MVRGWFGVQGSNVDFKCTGLADKDARTPEARESESINIIERWQPPVNPKEPGMIPVCTKHVYYKKIKGKQTTK